MWDRQWRGTFLCSVRAMRGTLKRRLRAMLWVSGIVLAGVKSVHAQIPTNEQWLTIRTPHFRVHFTREEEVVGRRAAAAAERAYANLASELVPPRGIIDVVVTDAADGSNGAATMFPRNHVIVQARPPVDQTSLESYDDWMVLVLQHEVTHVFHLDRSRGWWRAAQWIFGRNPILFPNNYMPAWLTEGLAVYYESRFTSGGRLDGTYQYSIAHAAAMDREVPGLDQLSLATSRYPYGQAAYVYGAFIVDEMSQRYGAASVRRLVETASEEPVPFLLDRVAKRSFGETFTHAWRRWQDSVVRAAPATQEAGDWHVLPNEGRYIIHPRWRDDSTVIYFADDGRESPGLYVASLNGSGARVGRVTSVDAGAVGLHGTLVFGEQDYVDRLHVRSDLYELEQDGRTRRLTVGKRLSAPDVRYDGEIVAVQTAPGTTLLVRVSADGQRVVPITNVAPDTQWAAPRWSPDGRALAAVRITHGMSEIAILDTLGQVLQEFGRTRAVTRSPSWSGDGRGVFFTSDQSGASEVYYARVGGGGRAGDSMIAQRTAWPTGLYDVDARSGVNAPLVSTVLQRDGLHVVTFRPGVVREVPATDTAPPVYEGGVVRQPAVLVPDTTRATAYSPWATLLPAYWSPLFSSGSQYGSQIGGVTTGADVVGRHSYLAQALVNTSNRHVDALATYTYSRFFNPVFGLSAEQAWSYTGLYDNTTQQRVGVLQRLTRQYSLQATFARPRAFNYSALVLGAELETRDYNTAPSTLMPQLLSFYQQEHSYPTLLAELAFSNAQRPSLSISPEDGISISLTGRQRWADGIGNSSAPSAVLVTSLYKSLDFPGFAHHVLALYGAAGATNNRSPGEYSAGGVSGGSLQVVPGLTLGDQQQTFPVRGFPSGAEEGIRAVAGSAEYRVPLSMPSRGLGLWPIFLDRTSLTFFADAGEAYCPRNVSPPGPTVSGPACGTLDSSNPLLTSVGAELNMDTALQFDVPYRFRFGIARPLHGREEFAARAATIYATLGINF
jgi:hypothetical protein